jgi:hypothetical protein
MFRSDVCDQVPPAHRRDPAGVELAHERLDGLAGGDALVELADDRRR